MASARSKTDHFFLILVSSVVIMTSVFVLGKMTWWSEETMAVAKPKAGVSLGENATAAEMMRVLGATVDDGGESEFRQLERDASGL